MAGAMLLLGVTILVLGTMALMRDAAGRGHSPLVFLLPLVGLPYVQENWQEVWWAALLRVFGVALLLLGAGLMVARDPLVLEQPSRLFGAGSNVVLAGSQRAELNTFVGSEEAILLAIRNDDNPHLTGRLNGRDFHYQRVELVDGVFSAQQGDGFIPELEVRILLPENPLPVRERKSIYVRPGDEHPPEVHLSWRNPGQDLPETQIITGGYRMELHLAPLDRYQLSGFMQLILPDTRHSFLSGEFIASTNRLRYVNGNVDLSFDHPDTLNYLVDQYLAGQFPSGMVRQLDILDTTLRRREGTGTSHVRIALTNGRVEERVLQMERTEVGWVMRPGSATVTVLEAGEQGEMRLATPSRAVPARQETVADVPAPVALPFAELLRFSGQQVTVLRASGEPQQGIVRGMQRGRLVLETTVGSGTLEYFVEQADLVGLRLASGQQVTVLDGARTDPLPAPAPAIAPAADVAEATSSEQAEPSPHAGLVGRMVRITSHDGRSRTGVLSAATATQLTLEVPVGSGTLEYYYRPEEVDALEQVARQ
jgi:hypothetical protein